MVLRRTDSADLGMLSKSQVASATKAHAAGLVGVYGGIIHVDTDLQEACGTYRSGSGSNRFVRYLTLTFI